MSDTTKGYFKKMGKYISPEDGLHVKVRELAVKLSKELNLQIQKLPNNRNLYHVDVLEIVFEKFKNNYPDI